MSKKKAPKAKKKTTKKAARKVRTFKRPRSSTKVETRKGPTPAKKAGRRDPFPIVVRVPAKIRKQLDAKAKLLGNGATRSEVVRRAIDVYLATGTVDQPVFVDKPVTPSGANVTAPAPVPVEQVPVESAPVDAASEEPIVDGTPIEESEGAEVTRTPEEKAAEVERFGGDPDPLRGPREVHDTVERLPDPEAMNGAADVLGGPGDPDATLGDLQSPPAAQLRDGPAPDPLGSEALRNDPALAGA